MEKKKKRRNSDDKHNFMESRWKKAKERLSLKETTGLFKTKLISYGKTPGEKEVDIQGPNKASRSRRQKIDSFLFLPNSIFIRVWDLLVIFLLIYTAYAMPYYLAFSSDIDEGNWFYANLIVDCLFITDILVNLNTAYYNDSILIASRRAIFMNYLKGWLILDIIASIPTNLLEIVIFGGNTEFNMRTLRLARLPRLYRLIRMTRFIKLSRVFKKSVIFSQIKEFFEVNSGFGRLIIFALVVITCVHVMGCFWCYFAKLDDQTPKTWVVRFGYQDANSLTLYLASIYWTFQTLLTVGYGDFGAFTTSIAGLCFINNNS